MILAFTIISIVAAFTGLYYLISADSRSRGYNPDPESKVMKSATLLIIISVLALWAAYVGEMK